MFAAAPRNRAYEAALRQIVGPSSVVVDVGTGCGLFALIAARAGAARVYAIEPDPIVQVARDLAAANGLADRITFIEASSFDAALPETADVMVSDVRAVLPLTGESLTTLIDARRRLLKPGGVMIPRADTLVAALAAAPEVFRDAIEAWDECWGIDARAVRGAAAQQAMSVAAEDVEVIGDPVRWATLDYTALASPSVRGTLAWRIARPATAHGLALWFETQLAEGIGYSTAPGGDDRLYGLAFLPWPLPVALAADDRVEVSLRADPVGGDYVWTWNTSIAGAEPRRFAQSTFAGAPLSRERIRRLAIGRRHLQGGPSDPASAADP